MILQKERVSGLHFQLDSETKMLSLNKRKSDKYGWQQRI